LEPSGIKLHDDPKLEKAKLEHYEKDKLKHSNQGDKLKQLESSRIKLHDDQELEEVKLEHYEKDKLKYSDQDEKLEVLKESAIKYYEKFEEDDCKKIIEKLQREFKVITDSQRSKSRLLHCAVFSAHARGRLRALITTGEATAAIKFLLGVDPTIRAENASQYRFSKTEDIDWQNESGKTALHLAATTSGAILYWLLKLKADPFIEDQEGKTFYDYIPESWKLIKASLRHYKKPEEQVSQEEKIF